MSDQQYLENGEEWISAASALAFVKALMPYEAERTICKRANDGLIKARAVKFICDGKSFEDFEVPQKFWWAQGYEALEQNWVTGDFATWIDSDIHLKAYGVSFLRSDVEKMIDRGKVADPKTLTLSSTSTNEIANSPPALERELRAPEKATIGFLINHMPLSWWGWILGIATTIFFVGTQAARVSFLQPFLPSVSVIAHEPEHTTAKPQETISSPSYKLYLRVEPLETDADTEFPLPKVTINNHPQIVPVTYKIEPSDMNVIVDVSSAIRFVKGYESVNNKQKNALNDVSAIIGKIQNDLKTQNTLAINDSCPGGAHGFPSSHSAEITALNNSLSTDMASIRAILSSTAQIQEPTAKAP